PCCRPRYVVCSPSSHSFYLGNGFLRSIVPTARATASEPQEPNAPITSGCHSFLKQPPCQWPAPIDSPGAKRPGSPSGKDLRGLLVQGGGETPPSPRAGLERMGLLAPR